MVQFEVLKTLCQSGLASVLYILVACSHLQQVKCSPGRHPVRLLLPSLGLHTETCEHAPEEGKLRGKSSVTWFFPLCILSVSFYNTFDQSNTNNWYSNKQLQNRRGNHLWRKKSLFCLKNPQQKYLIELETHGLAGDQSTHPVFSCPSIHHLYPYFKGHLIHKYTYSWNLEDSTMCQYSILH